jgi:hypothetical protein
MEPEGAWMPESQTGETRACRARAEPVEAQLARDAARSGRWNRGMHKDVRGAAVGRRVGARWSRGCGAGARGQQGRSWPGRGMAQEVQACQGSAADAQVQRSTQGCADTDGA